ncbi:MAG TPA: hypothetical protein PLS19_12615, partial [bacterium]|nr:hypothetical protein [bacterium]
ATFKRFLIVGEQHSQSPATGLWGATPFSFLRRHFLFFCAVIPAKAGTHFRQIAKQPHDKTVNNLGLTPHCAVNNLGLTPHCAVNNLGLTPHCAL